MNLNSKPLSEADIKFFHEEGYLVVRDLIPVNDLQPVIDEITSEIDWRAKKLVEEGALSRPYAEHGFETRLAKISQETDKVALAIWNGILHGPAIFHLISHPRLVDLAEQLCGPEVIASSVYRLRPKIPNYGYGAVPWHQDSSYFEPYCDKALVLTAWLPLVNATKENGCMYVIPKSHRLPVVTHNLHASGKYLEISEDNLPEGEWICCPVPKGGVLLVTNRTVHGSFLNTTDGVRWSMDLRYQSASLPTNADITRLPGEDMPSVELGVPAACYPPEADFLVRSQQRPNEVVSSYEQFKALRENHQAGQVTNRWGVTWGAPKVTVA
jgi:ectoine hydroxylase-related dioxygenase (phytanoyl-CoA dioxygenase family)